ncbi:uncharacterized protein LOC144445366 [Glandiceps talaboti]
MYDNCARNDSTETTLDQIIHDIMRIIIHHQGWYEGYEILLREATRREFEVCGAQVTSDTNVLLSYRDQEHKSFPLILSENKSGNIEKDTEPTSSVHRKKKKRMEHKKISQVIGQSLSVGEESPFETDDYKIVYHISLMGFSNVVINRTHIAKSTLTAMKAGCMLSIAYEPLPSFVLEKVISTGRQPFLMFYSLYTPIYTLMKVSFRMYNPTEHDKKISKPYFPKLRKRKLHETISSKSKNK